MSFKLLKQLVTHLRQKTICPFCKIRFPEDSFFVLATSMDFLTGAGLFFIVCPKCFAQAFLFAEVTNVTAKLREENIRVQTKSAKGVTMDEILDMHNFLKTWQGDDVKELF